MLGDSTVRAFVSVIVVLGLSVAAWAQPAATYKSGSEFYMAHRAAFAKAKTIDEILPWMTMGRREQVGKTPAAERAQMFGMIKAMDDHTGIKVDHHLGEGSRRVEDR